jgi:hypothetical protein
MGRSSWWVHLPGTMAIASMIAVMAYRRPWPSRAPVHFNLHFTPDRWGSPWNFAVFPLLVGMILMSQMIASAAWKRHEEGRKRFNLALLLTAAPLGAIVGIHWWYWANLPQLAETGRADHAWGWVWISASILVLVTILLEIVRDGPPKRS